MMGVLKFLAIVKVIYGNKNADCCGGLLQYRNLPVKNTHYEVQRAVCRNQVSLRNLVSPSTSQLVKMLYIKNLWIPAPAGMTRAIIAGILFFCSSHRFT
jgi:hypothetical protein